MLLKSLELHGFKTFPDKTSLKFEQGVSSVVGPNGSGKSNISDAIRWVMGEQSARVLRCSKMEDVIFSGTPKRRGQGYAEVTLNIDNTDRRLAFDNDNVAIVRRYYRSGESEYLINKNTVRLKDINELFMDTGLGRDGYSVIGQGKIDSIVGAKSEDRREIFEEASGISRYRYRKEESERRLNRAEENLVRLRDILSELEDRVEPLRIQAEKAEKFIAYDAEKKELEIGIWVETLNRSGKILREHNEKIDLARSQHQSISQEIEDISRKIEENHRETNSCTAHMDFNRNEAARYDEQAVRIDGEISVLMNDISHNGQNIERIKGQIEAAAMSEKDIDSEIEEKKSEIEEKNAAVEESRNKLNDYTARLESLRGDTDEATRKIEETAIELAQLNAKLSEENIKLSSAKSSISEINIRAGAVDESILQNRQRLEKLEQELADLKVMGQDISRSISEKENAVKGYEMRLESRRRKLDNAKNEADRLNLDANEQERKAKLLENLERNLEGFAYSVKAVMKESERGVLSGVYGPVTKIIHSPSEYATALETSLGAAMQNIVVESERDAKNAINFLKKKSAGRATFLPLSNIRGSVIAKRDFEDMVGFVGIAAELCTCEPKFESVKNSLLGRVVVAEDLDSATAIAKRVGYKYRIVSLDGQVVNAGGSLTGGAKVKSSGLLSRTSDIEKTKEKAEKLRAQSEAALQEYKDKLVELSGVQAELEAEKAELSSLQEERIKVLSEYARADRDIKSAQQEAQNLELERTNSSARIAELERAVSKAEKMIFELEAKAKQVREESEKLSKHREDQLSRSGDIGSVIQEIRLSEFSAQKDRDNLKQTISELEYRKQNSTEMAEKLNGEILELEEKSISLQKQIDIKKLESKEQRDKAEEKRRQSEEVSIRRNELEKESVELRQSEKELSTSRESYGHEIARLQERLENSQKEYDGIISKLWEEYELTRDEAQAQGKPIEDLQAAQRRLNELKSKIKALGSVNVAAVVEYKEVSERYEFLKEQIEDVEKSKAELIKLIGELTKQMREQFVERFAEINKNFGTIFKELFGGGSARLSFTDEADVLSSGIDITVHPPGKIVTNIESLSGGEKALVAISIYFAIMRVSPPPFCVLDEIEAALDDVNVTRFAQYLRRMSDKTQFVVITHRRGTMEESDMLYGVTMQDQGISKLLALKTHEEAEKLQAIS